MIQAPAKPKGVTGMICPRRNVDCGAEDGCQVCYDWMHMEGEDPVTGEKIAGFDCVAHWQIKIGLHQIRAIGGGLDGVQKATESFRNEMVEANKRGLAATLLAAKPQRQLIGQDN